METLNRKDILDAGKYGERAHRLSVLSRAGIGVPRTAALSEDEVKAIQAGGALDTGAILAAIGESSPLCLRGSPGKHAWGGPGSMLNVGMTREMAHRLGERIGEEAAAALYAKFIRAFAIYTGAMGDEALEALGDESLGPAAKMDLAESLYRSETGSPFPQDPGEQIEAIAREMIRQWSSPSAELLRSAQGAPESAGFGIIAQEMRLSVGAHSGIGSLQFVRPTTGERELHGYYYPDRQGDERLPETVMEMYPVHDMGTPSLGQMDPGLREILAAHSDPARKAFCEEIEIEFVHEGGAVWIVDAFPARMSVRGTVRTVVNLASDGIIEKERAIARIAPGALADLVHPQLNPEADLDVIATGLGASPGAAVGKIVFSAVTAQAMAASGISCVLVRPETSPGDVHGMHVAKGVVTQKGGMTSHAAVVARGLGLPCVVGVEEISVDEAGGTFAAKDGRVFREGDCIALDGRTGKIIAGSVELAPPVMDEFFVRLLSWADGIRDLQVRANADTPADARLARRFGAEGIGLCRTEHMFFEESRLSIMRSMIFADTEGDRRRILSQLLPIQRDDFTELFTIMRGMPVCIRLFDPPLHEFLPRGDEEVGRLAEALGLPAARVFGRMKELREYNPMLGMRGVRLGIMMPEIYEMQARAIFEASLRASGAEGRVVPEIMVPLVSANREGEIMKSLIDGVARTVRRESGQDFEYRLGMMIETPRATLRAGDLAGSSDFFSFGTNDLTQMTYGLSRDDAGKLMSFYVKEGVFEEDPFQSLDAAGVGELLLMAVERARKANPGMVFSICGEHGGDPDSLRFVSRAGFDYVSCSPYRVPIARLAAAHCAKSVQGFLGDRG